jgi:hypothetical protein
MNDRNGLRNKVTFVTGAGRPMTASGHSRRFDDVPITSAFPQERRYIGHRGTSRL